MMKIRPNFRRSIPMTLIALFSSTTVIAAVTSGSLVVFNGLANLASATGVGFTASPIKVQVSDSTAICSTTNSVAYNGAVVIPWSAANTHSSSVCTGIKSVMITALANPYYQVAIYGATTAIPATGTVTFTAPTTDYAEMVLIPVGRATAITAADATHWGNALLGVEPTFNTAGGDLASAGVPGVTTVYGVRARQFLMARGIKIPSQKDKTAE